MNAQPAYDLFTYPSRPGWKGAETSRDAADDMRPKAARLQRLCLDALRQANEPLTADEIADRLQIDRLAIRPRLSELSKLGKVIDSGARHKNDSGKNAVAWRVP